MQTSGYHSALPGQTPSSDAHFLTFDVEEYFQVEAAAARVSRADWPQFQRRLGPAVDRILQLLKEHRQRATFFVLGWVARVEPDVVRRIAAAGHEIASHGMTHAMLQTLTPEQFRRELVESRALLEDVGGCPVIGYRAPTFSVTHRTAWAIDVLAASGYRYDSSVFPVRHDRYGVPEAPRWPHLAVGPGGGCILELPPLTRRVLRANLPIGGGGYMRLLPIRMLGKGLRQAGRSHHRAMLYLHPWELDAGQPVLPMTRASRFRQRVNLARTETKLHWLLDRFRFIEVRQALEGLCASATTTFAYGKAARAA